MGKKSTKKSNLIYRMSLIPVTQVMGWGERKRRGRRGINKHSHPLHPPEKSPFLVLIFLFALNDRVTF